MKTYYSYDPHRSKWKSYGNVLGQAKIKTKKPFLEITWSEYFHFPSIFPLCDFEFIQYSKTICFERLQ